jgi:ectoine hydroxylase-related dioxygenase (phytanoyl-CoA dioxygenase family)
MNVVTVWLALDPSLKENGCMMVIPTTHRTGKQGYSDYSPVENAVFGNEIIQEQLDHDKRVYVELQPNQASLHNARIQHGSEPNTSNLRRCGWTLRFTSSAVKFADFKGAHQVYMARGRDLGGNTYADPTKSYPEVMKTRGASTRYKNSH